MRLRHTAGMSSVSCGVLIFDERRRLLMAHATGGAHWDIPKGLADPGEAPIEAALRAKGSDLLLEDRSK